MKTQARDRDAAEEQVPTSLEKWISILSSVWPVLTALVLVSGMIIMNNYKADTALALAASNAEAIDKVGLVINRIQDDRSNKYAELKSDSAAMKADVTSIKESLNRIERKIDERR